MTDQFSSDNAPTPSQALNRAMRESVDFIHAEGWDQPPTLFALVPASILAQATGDILDEKDEGTYTLVVQDLPETDSPAELEDYIARTAWPAQVEGAILAQEIMFTDSSTPDATARPARLFSGVIDGGPNLTLLQLRPTDEEIEQAGPFAEDNIELLGGPDVAPGVIALLESTFEEVLDPESPEDFT